MWFYIAWNLLWKGFFKVHKRSLCSSASREEPKFGTRPERHHFYAPVFRSCTCENVPINLSGIPQRERPVPFMHCQNLFNIQMEPSERYEPSKPELLASALVRSVDVLKQQSGFV